jgi:hypothetical protein
MDLPKVRQALSPVRFFCATQSRTAGETLYGTVAQIRSWLLLEYPNVWPHDAVERSCLYTPEFQRHIRRLRIERSLLIRQEYRRYSSFRCFVAQSCDERPSLTRYTFPNYSDLRSFDAGGERVNDLLFAVCTHGRHDKCCAKFGLPVWQALRHVAGERAWECSHVGGDRFAGNVAVFPYGIYYGRVTPEDVPELVARSEAGEIWLPGYRGRSCYPRRVQVAEYFARAESGRLRIDEFRALATEHAPPEITRVTFRAASDATLHSVEFITRPRALRERLTCEAEEESPVTQYELCGYTVR